MAEEIKAPVGFKAVPYPNVLTMTDDTMYVCQECQPAWDTFDLAVAKAHTAAGIHRPELDPILTGAR
jgi:hypothetical protein